MPPGVERVQLLSNNGVNLQQNEQAMSLKISNLVAGDARGVFKTLNYDFRQYGKLSMFLHAESVTGQRPLKDYEINAIVRIGQDFLNNYYEIRIPLKITPPGTYTRGQETAVWPTENNLDLSLRSLIDLKLLRNNSGASVTTIFRQALDNKTISILGNPNLGEVTGVMVAIENPLRPDGAIVNTEVWVNELRLSELDENGGWAALGRVDMTLADLGTISVSANTHTQGFGTIEQRVNERAKDNLVQFDIATSIDAGKLMPKQARLSLPVYASINRTVLTPQYDPYDLDILYKEKLKNAPKNIRDSIRNAAIDQTTIKTLNFTNVRFLDAGKKPGLLRLSNFDFNYSYSQISQSSPLVQQNIVTKQRGGFGYTYNKPTKYIEPFKGMIRTQTPWLALFRDFNFNLMPSYLSFRTDINRQFGEFIPRIVNAGGGKVDRVDTTYDKYFTFDRYYGLRWDLSRSLNLDFNATNNARIDEPYGRIDTKEKKDTVRKNFFSGGRNTLYQQRVNLGYSLPLNKFPLTDWINARYNYSTSYNWIGASRLALNLGNTLENSQENTFTAQFNFAALYNKSKWLRALDNVPVPKPANANNNPSKPQDKKSALGTEIPTKAEVVKGLKGKKRREALKKWRKQKRDARIASRLQKANEPTELNGFTRAAGKLVTMVRNVTLQYSENYSSRVPGYMDSTKYLGQDWKTMAPGLDYVFGKQPDTKWLEQKAAQGLLTRDSTFNFLYRQTFQQHLLVTAQLEPIRELVVNLSLEKTFSKDYSELYKDTTGSAGFSHLNPLSAGGFDITYISFNTLFGKQNPNEISATFKTFENNRRVISRRVAEANPYWQSAGQKFTADGYAEGYGRYAQDVLVPAFIAAYTKQDPNSVSLLRQSNTKISSNPFGGILPKPNWRLTYTGLTKYPALASIFQNITLTHGYNGHLSMNSFNSALLYQDPFHFNAPGFIDTVSGNYIPFFLVPNITIKESFEPLIGVEITTVDNLNLSFKYSKSRQLSLSLIDYQLSESRSTGWTFGFGLTKKGVNLPFTIPGTKGKKLQNDLNIRLDLSMNDVSTSNSRLDQANAYGTGGQKQISIQPSIDYVLNNRINVKLFFDQQKTIPYISTSAPITNTRAGVSVRISLAQ
jgi:cell surface protein SprA